MAARKKTIKAPVRKSIAPKAQAHEKKPSAEAKAERGVPIETRIRAVQLEQEAVKADMEADNLPLPFVPLLAVDEASSLAAEGLNFSMGAKLAAKKMLAHAQEAEKSQSVHDCAHSIKLAESFSAECKKSLGMAGQLSVLAQAMLQAIGIGGELGERMKKIILQKWSEESGSFRQQGIRDAEFLKLARSMAALDRADLEFKDKLGRMLDESGGA